MRAGRPSGVRWKQCTAAARFPPGVRTGARSAGSPRVSPSTVMGAPGWNPETCAPRLVEREPAAREITPRRVGGGDGRCASQEPRLGFGLTLALGFPGIPGRAGVARHRASPVAHGALVQGRQRLQITRLDAPAPLEQGARTSRPARARAGAVSSSSLCSASVWRNSGLKADGVTLPLTDIHPCAAGCPSLVMVGLAYGTAHLFDGWWPLYGVRLINGLAVSGNPIRIVSAYPSPASAGSDPTPYPPGAWVGRRAAWATGMRMTHMIDPGGPFRAPREPADSKAAS